MGHCLGESAIWSDWWIVTVGLQSFILHDRFHPLCSANKGLAIVGVDLLWPPPACDELFQASLRLSAVFILGGDLSKPLR